MAASPFALIKTRRLGPLCAAQACGALNDNLVKNAMIVLALFKLGADGAALPALAGALFIAPYILLSATAGQVADRFDKSRVILAAKAAEVLLMCCAALGFITGSMPILLGILFGLGVQAAVFGPLKYGILPDHMTEDELVAANGAVEASTFLAILIGTVAGGALILHSNGGMLVAVTGVVVALVGLGAASAIPRAAPADGSLRIGWNLLRETLVTVRHARAIRAVWLSILGLSWFWTIGATLLTEFPAIVKDTMHASGSVVTLLLTVFAIGVGIGSILCAKLLHGEVSPRYVPFAALGISIFCWDFATASMSGQLLTVTDVLSTPAGWRMVADLLLLAACGGAFSVPLYAIIQDYSPKESRARTIAGNNIVNALFMVVGAAAAAGLDAAGVTPPHVLVIAAIINLFVAVWIIRLLPQHVLCSLFRFYFNTFHGVDVSGLEHYREAGDRVVIVANHTSFFDACLIACYLPDSPTFAVHTRTAERFWVKVFLSAVDIFKVDVQSPYSIKRMVEAVRDHGRKLMIFPEGRLTKTGALMKVYEGAGVVADRAHAMVLPISVDGLQFTRLSRMKGKVRMRWFPRLALAVMPPVNLSPDPSLDLTPRQRREAVGRALQDLLVDTVFQAKPTDLTLFAALLDARRKHGGRTAIAEDIQREPITYNRVILGAAALGRQLERVTTEGERVGVLLPNANGTVVTFMALQAFARVPAMLNVSAGADGMLSSCAAADIKIVLSSRAFVARAKGVDKIVARMEEKVRFVWIDDLLAGIGGAAKARAWFDAMRASALPGAVVAPDAPAVVLFTSGSEGTPKGVVLSHRNIVANCAQLSTVVDFNSADRVFNALPMFHSFGLTGGTLLPLFHGVRTFHYPSPLHYRIVPSLIYDTDATICFGTDTFLKNWAKYAHPYDYYSMRYVFAGAEKVSEETKRMFADRFGVRILEGYGATETSPALAMNTAMLCRSGTVGQFLPGIEWRLEPIQGVEHGGRLHVRGPNIMLGYLRTTAPGVIEPPPDGWYDTGDIVTVDGEGFVTITGRAKRFAKIAGEMVSMTAAESFIVSLWPSDLHAVVSLPDARKGEQLLLVTTHKAAGASEILAHARTRGTPEIMVPRAVMVVDAMPLLATGKIDYPGVSRLVAERGAPVSAAAGAEEDLQGAEAAQPA